MTGTHAGSEEYSKMLRAADECENVTTETIVGITEDILQHSDTDRPLTSIYYEVAKICNSFFE